MLVTIFILVTLIHILDIINNVSTGEGRVR